MRKLKIDARVPRSQQLIPPTFSVLKSLGGSGSNQEILEGLIVLLRIPDDVVDIPHNGSTSLSELSYQAAWARTYMRIAGIISNSSRAVWAITPAYMHHDTVDAKEIMSRYRNEASNAHNDVMLDPSTNDGTEITSEAMIPVEVSHWRKHLAQILHTMDPFGFERLSQRLLRECGFSQVEVTKKSGDGGIDGTGKLKINGIFTFSVAFQCKRFSGIVGASIIRDFRGSLTTDIEKGVLITTGAFSRSAREEAATPGKQQIDLIDGEELITLIAELGIGVKEIKTYEVDEAFFLRI